MYSTIDGVKMELQEDLYIDAEIDADIVNIDEAKVIPWINGAVSRSFTESDLTGTDALIRLASCKYAAYSLMSSVLEGHNIEQVSLALHRLDEAKAIIKMWCRTRGITPSFADEEGAWDGVRSRVGVDFAVAVGTDENCI